MLSILPNYIPHVDNSTKLGVVGSKVFNQLHVSFDKTYSQHGFPRASNLGRS
jgi:hypothetical protein